MCRDTGDDTHRLPGPLLLAVSQCEGVRTFVQSCDNLVYQNLVDMLMPEVLRPIPSKNCALPCAVPWFV